MTSKKVPREEIPWFPTISEEKCSKCMTCVSFCQHGVYEEIEGEPRVAKPFNCIVGCTGCEPQCPEKAISFPSMKETSELLKNLRKKYGVK